MNHPKTKVVSSLLFLDVEGAVVLRSWSGSLVIWAVLNFSLSSLMAYLIFVVHLLHERSFGILFR